MSRHAACGFKGAIAKPYLVELIRIFLEVLGGARKEERESLFELEQGLLEILREPCALLWEKKRMEPAGPEWKILQALPILWSLAERK